MTEKPAESEERSGGLLLFDAVLFADQFLAPRFSVIPLGCVAQTVQY
jgi:hypothetical protein